MAEPDSFDVDGECVCRLHHTPLVFDPEWAFDVNANYPGMGRDSHRFPNPKWGHPATPEMAEWELVGVWHCPKCEVDRQRWLAGQH
jgi:hypothetical protein